MTILHSKPCCNRWVKFKNHLLRCLYWYGCLCLDRVLLKLFQHLNVFRIKNVFKVVLQKKSHGITSGKYGGHSVQLCVVRELFKAMTRSLKDFLRNSNVAIVREGQAPFSINYEFSGASTIWNEVKNCCKNSMHRLIASFMKKSPMIFLFEVRPKLKLLQFSVVFQNKHGFSVANICQFCLFHVRFNENGLHW